VALKGAAETGSWAQAWAVVGATVDEEQQAPPARCPSTGDEYAPSVGRRTARVARRRQAPAHARCLPALRARPTCLREDIRERTQRVARRTYRTALVVCVWL